MGELYSVSRFMVQFFGPLLVVCLVLMYLFVVKYTGKAPKPREVVFLYVRHNIEKRRHAGLLTYLLILGAIFFFLSATGLIAGYLLR